MIDGVRTMPWTVRKRGSGWVVVKKTTGKVASRHKTKAKAQASIRARHTKGVK